MDEASPDWRNRPRLAGSCKNSAASVYRAASPNRS